jgi:hypothetical protein
MMIELLWALENSSKVFGSKFPEKSNYFEIWKNFQPIISNQNFELSNQSRQVHGCLNLFYLQSNCLLLQPRILGYVLFHKMSEEEIQDATPPIIRRNRPGTSRDNFNNWPPLELDQMEGALAAQQFLQQTIALDISNVKEILKLPEGQDPAVWKYEQLRYVLFNWQNHHMLLFKQSR